MLTRPHTTSQPQLFFTQDYHQFPRGLVEPGASCTIAYDPQRILPPGATYTFGDPSQAIIAHLQFQPDGPILDLPLESWSGINTHTFTHRSGRGHMLRATFTIPNDALWITVWFSYHPAGDQIHYDSNHGQNFQIRFHDDLRVVDASVEGDPTAPLHTLHCSVDADRSIERITAVYRVTNTRGGDSLPHAWDLRRGQAGMDGLVRWELDGAPVPHNAVVAFEFIYYADGRQHKDNNQGRYFLAAHQSRLPIQS